MKKNIFLYLFVFAALIALYLFVSEGKMSEVKEAQVVKLKNELALFKDSVQGLQLKVLDMQYFSLQNNDDALAYYEHLDVNDPARYIADKLLEKNESPGNNPLVPYEGMEGDFKLNKIKIMNHKWIIADFSDGSYWGEILLKYELKDTMDADFTLIDHLLYSRSH